MGSLVEMGWAKAEGYFTNNDNGFFGAERPHEFLRITYQESAWQALKIVGDRNVPREYLSFRTQKTEIGDNITDFMEIEIQIRSDIKDENDFSWGWDGSLRFDVDSDEWIVLQDGESYAFTRCHKIEALEAAKNLTMCNFAYTHIRRRFINWVLSNK